MPELEGVEGSAQDWKPGDVLAGLYRVDKVIGRGGMGYVYRVYHRGWGIDLAVKSPRADILARTRGAEFFERECDMWVNLGLHPNIVSCFYVRRIDDVPRVFAEYVSGGSLWNWIQSRRLYRGESEEVVARIMDVACQMAWGLRHAHSQGLVHQDVKPGNILMTADGIAKVTDFGLSKAVAVARGGVKGGNTRGTAVYCSPEQARGQELGMPTDIWSWAVCVLEAFVGEVTWMAGQAAGRALETYVELGPEDERIPLMPPALVDLLRACFKSNPAERPRGMDDVIARLRKAYAGATGTEYPRSDPKPEAISADRLNNRAVSVLDLGKQKEAEALWLEALKAEPGHVQSTYNRAMVHWRKGRVTDTAVVRVLEKLSANTRDEALADYMRALFLLERGDSAGALDILERMRGQSIPGHNVEHDITVARNRLPTARKVERVIGKHDGPVHVVRLSWDASLVLAGGGKSGQPGELKLWEIAESTCLHNLQGHSKPVTAAGFTSDGMGVLSGDADGVVRTWNMVSGDPGLSLAAHQGTVRAVHMSQDGRRLLSAGDDGLIRLWEMESGNCVSELAGHGGAVTAAALCLFDTHVLSIGMDATCRLWNLETRKPVGDPIVSDSPLTCLTLSYNGQYAISGSTSGCYTLWGVKKFKELRRVKAHRDPVLSAVFSKDMNYAITATSTGQARIWQTSTGRCVHTIECPAPLDVGPGSTTGVAGGSDGALRLLSLGCQARVKPAPLMVCGLTGH